MEDMQKQVLNALLELIKRHAESTDKEQFIEDIKQMQSKLEDTTKKAVSAEPEQ